MKGCRKSLIVNTQHETDFTSPSRSPRVAERHLLKILFLLEKDAARIPHSLNMKQPDVFQAAKWKH